MLQKTPGHVFALYTYQAIRVSSHVYVYIYIHISFFLSDADEATVHESTSYGTGRSENPHESFLMRSCVASDPSEKRGRRPGVGRPPPEGTRAKRIMHTRRYAQRRMTERTAGRYFDKTRELHPRATKRKQNIQWLCTLAPLKFHKYTHQKHKAAKTS